ncbi:MAG: hypothetical protein JXM70_04100 [Pirellulales bacterium]|nr:hypothetical protein [Pirellulales bacterium]
MHTKLRHIRFAAYLLLVVSVLSVGLYAGSGDATETRHEYEAITGPAPSYGIGGEKVVLIKNWDFGTSGDSTITNQSVMNEHFQYHDQFGTFANGTKYGAYIVAPDEATATKYMNKKQPVESVNTDRPVREFTENSLKTFVVPLDKAERVHPAEAKAGCGSFQAKWTLDRAGSHLGRDVIWETRVRYKTAPYYWFAIWVAGHKWNRGAEIDVIESFGYDNGGGHTNFDGRYWHSSGVGGNNETNYHKNWAAGMAKYGFKDFDAGQWHVWTMLLRADDTFTVYLDGKPVQNGKMPWTLKAVPDGEPLNMSFIFDGAWGHREVKSVNHWLDAAALKDLVYEWDYSRVYLSEKGD